MTFHVTLEHAEDGWVVAECPALPGCVSQGKDEKDALDNIRAAITAWLWAEDQKAGTLPGVSLEIQVRDERIEIEPSPRDVRLVRKGRLTVAIPAVPSQPLTAEIVERVLNDVSAGRMIAAVEPVWIWENGGMRETTLTELRNHARTFFDAVEEGETVRVYRNGRPVADIVPVKTGTPAWKQPPRTRSLWAA